MPNSCSIEKLNSIAESAKFQLEQLKDLSDQGLYIVDDIDIDEAMKAMQTIIKDKKRSIAELKNVNDITSAVLYNLQNPVKVYFNGAKRGYNRTIRKVVDKDDYVVAIFTDDSQYTFNKGQDRSTQTKNGKFVVIEGFGQAIDSMVLYSKDDIKAKVKLGDEYWGKFEELEANVHKDITKSVDLLNKINELDGNDTSETHMNSLRSLLGSINPEFFKNMKVFLNTNAEETGGVVTSTKIGVMISKARSLAGNRQTAAESYAHELVHAYTMFATNLARSQDVEARKIYRKIKYVMDTMQKNVTWEQFLGNTKVEDATTEEIKNAKEMYDYIFYNENAIDEFIAHVLTNPIVSKLASDIMIKEEKQGRTVFDRIKGLFSDIVKFMSGEYTFKNKNKNVYEVTKDLAFMFAEYNNKAVTEANNKKTFISSLNDTFNDLEKTAANNIIELTERLFPDITSRLGDIPKDAVGKSLWYGKALGYLVLSKEHRKLLLVYLDQVGVMNSSGTIASVIRDFMESDALEKTIDWLQLAADKIDQAKMNVILTTEDIIKKGYSRVLSKYEEELVTEVFIDTDIQSIQDKYTNDELIKILKDKNELAKAITKAKKELKILDPKNYDWHEGQASGLGFYLATGKRHIAQNINAQNIAKGWMSRNYKKPFIKTPGDLVYLIDEIATLESLKHIAENKKIEVAALFETETSGVNNTISRAKFLKELAESTIFQDQGSFMIKGYTKEIFEDGIEIEVAKVSDREAMKSRGFEFVKELQGSSLVSTKEQYALYKSKSFGRSDWHRSATRLTKLHTKGTSIKDIYYDAEGVYDDKKYRVNKVKIDIERQKIADKIAAGTLDFKTIEYGLAPVLDEFGDVVDYRYEMAKDAKKELMEQDTRVSKVLGVTRGSILDKQKSIEHNTNVLDIIVKDAKENYVEGTNIGKNNMPYVLISDNSNIKEYKELWKVLPKSFKQEAMKNKEQGLPIRKDMLHTYFGYRELSFVDFPGLTRMMPTMLKNAVKIAEVIWQEFVKIVKIDILIKMPFVIVGNIVSNIAYAITTGSSPVEIFGLYRESIRDVRDYITKHRKLIKLEELVNAGIDVELNNKEIIKVKRNLEISPIHELYELGVYQAIVEDVGKEELSSQNKLKRAYKERTENIPKIIKDGINWLYLTEETQYYKFMTEVLQMSDLVARDIENRKMKKQAELVYKNNKELPVWYISHLKESNDDFAFQLRHSKTNTTDSKRIMSKEEKQYFIKVEDEYRKNQVLNNFINYNKVSGPVEEYLNKMGFIMFTKYAKRIQRVIVSTGVKYPLRSFLMLLSDSYIWDMETIQDQSILTRSWYNMQPQYPWERVLEVMTPALLQMPKNLSHY